MSGRLDGKVVIVTGASSGVGAATMKLFAAEGAKVVGAARRQQVLDGVLGEIEAAGGEGAVVAEDLSDPAAAARVIAAAQERFGGRVDVLVNSAGVGFSYGEVSPGSMDPLDLTTPEKWDEVMDINLGSAVHMSRLTLPVMLEQGAGSIVHVASILGFTGLNTAHTYTAAKGALINLARSMAVTYVARGVRSNVVAPGFIDTPMVAPVMNLFDDEAMAFQLSPMGRAATALEIAHGCLFFADDAVLYANGSVLTIDGGTTAKGF